MREINKIIELVQKSKKRIFPKKWLKLKGYKIFDDGLWRQKDPKNNLSELVEVMEIEYLGYDPETKKDIYCSKNEFPSPVILYSPMYFTKGRKDRAIVYTVLP